MRLLPLQRTILPALFAVCGCLHTASEAVGAIVVISPCSDLLQEADELDALDQKPIRPSHALTESRDLYNLFLGMRKVSEDGVQDDLQKVIELLERWGIRGRIKTIRDLPNGNSLGIELLIEPGSEDPMIRALNRIKEQWRSRGQELPQLILSHPSFRPKSNGSYNALHRRITFSYEVMAEYLETGYFPVTLMHELRHASFALFEDLPERLRVRHLRATVQSEEGLDHLQGFSVYSKYLRFEETYNHVRDLYSRFFRLKEIWSKHSMSEDLGLLTDQAWYFKRKLSSVPSILRGVESETGAALHALQRGSAVFSFSPHSSEVRMTYLNTQNHAVSLRFFCLGCRARAIRETWEVEKEAKQILLSERIHVLRILEAGDEVEPKLKALLDHLETFGKAESDRIALKPEIDRLFGEIARQMRAANPSVPAIRSAQ